jgi:glutamate carboxypeptidase
MSSHLLQRLLPMLALLLGTTAAAQVRDATELRILEAVESRQDGALVLLEETVNIQSATENHHGVRAVGAVLARELAALGFETRWIEVPADMERAGHLVAERSGARGRRLLLIGHLDTVLQGEPYRRDGNLAYGSGTADMKGGNLVIVEALRALHSVGALEGRNIRVLFTGDEEDPGLPHDQSRQALYMAASESDVALGFEGGSPGVAVIGRRGIGTGGSASPAGRRIRPGSSARRRATAPSSRRLAYWTGSARSFGSPA